MNRDTRKANLRKLQLPATANADAASTRRLRTQASANSSEAACVSDHFAASATKDSSKPQRKLKRQSLAAFIGIEPKDPKEKNGEGEKRLSDDFEVPEKKTKRAPTLKRHASKPKAKMKSSKTRQTNIKSAFLRNEEAFAEIAAQHSASDNFSADEMLLALAISKSEAESAHVDEGEEIVDLIGDAESQGGKNKLISSQDSIRTKLQKYGYRVAPKGEYSIMAASCLPQRRGKARWASKFTALTLRDPQLQSKKLHNYIESFLARQYCPAAPTDGAVSREHAYKLCSRSLARCQVFEDCTGCVVQKTFTDLEDYFVGELFEVSHLNAGHLLKDWSVIQGRDKSPLRSDARTREGERVLNQIYAELEQCFGQDPGNEPKCVMDTSDSVINSNKSPISIESPDIIESCNGTDKVKQNIEEEDTKKDTIVINTPPLVSDVDHTRSVAIIAQHSPDNHHTASMEEKSTALDNQTNRSTSPDLFAESDEEKENCMVDLNNGTDCIESFEIFSSDEDIAPVDEPKVSRDVTNGILDVSLDAIQTKGATEAVKTKSVLHIHSDDDVVPSHKNTQESPSIDQILSEADAFETDYIDLDEIDNEVEAHGHKGDVEIISVLDEKCSDVAVEIIEGTGQNQIALECEGHDLENSKNVLVSNPISNDIIVVDGNDYRHINLSSTKGSTDNNSFVQCSNRSQSDAQQSKGRISSFTEHLSEASIDLTQNDDENEGLMLSDDEINYSIWRSDNRRKSLKPPVKTYDEDIDASNPNHSGGEDVLVISSSNSECEDSNDLKEFSLIDFIHEDDEEPHVNGECKEGTTNDVVDTNVNGEPLMPSYVDPVSSQQTEDFTDILADASFVASPSANAAKFMKRYSSSLQTRKFSNFLEKDADEEFDEFDNLVYGFPQREQRLPHPNEQIVENTMDNGVHEDFTANKNEVAISAPTNDDCSVNNGLEFDEFDCLVYGSDRLLNPGEQPGQQPGPHGLDKLLTSQIFAPNDLMHSRVNPIPESSTSSQLSANGSRNVNELDFQEHRINNRVYKTRLVKGPQPDYEHMTDAELQTQLAAFGVKPMQRKHAVKLLAYIYQQTHISVKPDDLKAMQPQSSCTTTNAKMAKTKSMPIMSKPGAANNLAEGRTVASSQQVNNRFTKTTSSLTNPTICDSNVVKEDKTLKIQLQNNMELDLTRFSSDLTADLLHHEQWILQTNLRKTTAQPLVPLHIAWYNMVCANPALHEAILTYQPIDLQDVYMHLKSLGYRYEPKDLKTFCDQRCIIFRYDLKPAANERKSKPSGKRNKPLSLTQK